MLGLLSWYTSQQTSICVCYHDTHDFYTKTKQIFNSLTSCNKPCKQIHSLNVSHIAMSMYYDSVVDKVTIGCKPDFQDIQLPPNVKKKALVDLRES